MWYYEGNVRESLLRYKFGGRESYAKSYGRLLAMTLLEEDWTYDPHHLGAHQPPAEAAPGL